MGIFKIRGSSLIQIIGGELLEKHGVPPIPIINVESIVYRYMNYSEKEIIAEVTYKSRAIVQYVHHIDLNNDWRVYMVGEFIKFL
jgi:hypothetical protein